MTPRAKKILGVGAGVMLAWIAVLSLAFVVAKMRVPVSLPLRSGITKVGPDYVALNGTWTIDGSSDAFPVQTTQIQCDRSTSRCASATAQIQNGILRVRLEAYEIVNWTPSQIVYKDAAPICVDYVFTVDLLTDTVAGRRVRKPVSATSKEMCSDIDDDLRLRLVDGLSLSMQWTREALPWYGRVAAFPLRVFLGGS